MNVNLLKNLGVVFFSAALVAGAVEMDSTVTEIPDGTVVVDTITATATIKAIDAETRDITLETEDGSTEIFKAGPAVVNFDQLAAGDKVNVTLTEAVAVFLGKDATPSAETAGGAALAPVGGTPGGAVVGAAQITAKVTELNVKKRRATLLMPDDTIRKVKVREGFDLSRVAVGDSVTIAIAQGLAIEVEKP